MNKILEHGKKLVRNIQKNGKNIVISGTLASLLVCGLSSCDNKTDSHKDNDAERIEQGFSQTYPVFYEKNNLNVMMAYLLHDDQEKTVILLSQHGAKVSFLYKNKNREELYFNITSLSNMTVTTIENGETISTGQPVPLEKAKEVLAEITEYMK